MAITKKVHTSCNMSINQRMRIRSTNLGAAMRNINPATASFAIIGLIYSTNPLAPVSNGPHVASHQKTQKTGLASHQKTGLASQSSRHGLARHASTSLQNEV